jgi:hypothetical protein
VSIDAWLLLRVELTCHFDEGVELLGVEIGGSVIVDDVPCQSSGVNSRAGVIRFSGGEGETVGDDTVNCGVEHADKPISNAATRAKRFDMLFNL